jgi:hypothetical protein
MFNPDQNALLALLMGAGTPRGTAESPAGNPQNLLGAFELLSRAAAANTATAGNQTVTPPGVQVQGNIQDQEGLAQVSQNGQVGAALPAAGSGLLAAAAAALRR